jgi:hypothetical protein
MNNEINALIAFRLAKANEAFELAKMAIEKEFWFCCKQIVLHLFLHFNSSIGKI